MIFHLRNPETVLEISPNSTRPTWELKGVLSAWFGRGNYFHKKTTKNITFPASPNDYPGHYNRLRATFLYWTPLVPSPFFLCLCLGWHKNSSFCCPTGSTLSLEINEEPHHPARRQTLGSSLAVYQSSKPNVSMTSKLQSCPLTSLGHSPHHLPGSKLLIWPFPAGTANPILFTSELSICPVLASL